MSFFENNSLSESATWCSSSGMCGLAFSFFAPFLFLLSAVLPLMATMSSRSADISGTGTAAIVFDHRDDELVVRGLFEPEKDGAQGEQRSRQLQYTLVVERRGGGGTAETRQSGVFTPVAGPPDTLSTVHIRAPSGTQVIGELTISEDASTLDAARRTWPDP